MKLGTITAILTTAGAMLFAAGNAGAAPGEVPVPAVTGPIPASATSYPFLSTDIDLEKYGYVEEEFFISGDAYRYDTSGPVTQNAVPIESGGAGGDGKYDFKTRIVVRRPANPADANGQVVAEWNNVTATQDLEWNWFGDPYFLLENGYTFVGVTAQNTGVRSLKAFDSARYGDLTVIGRPPNEVPMGLVDPDGDPDGPRHDTDALSYDVFSAAINAIRGGGTGVDPMGGIDVGRVVASGESQSCGRLANYYNRFQQNHDIVNGFLLTVCGSEVRTDLPNIKVIRILSETENRTERTTADFPDTGSIRHWEVAAGSHLPRIAFDNINAILTRDFLALTVTCEKFPLSLVQWPYTQNAAIKALFDWSAGDAVPPIAPRGVYVANPDYDPNEGPSQANPEKILKRDQFGIALGGIRYPEVTVPTAVNDGTNAAGVGGSPFSAFCGLLGSSTPFPRTQLESLYTDYLDYVKKYSAAADAMIPTGFILPEDVVRLKAYGRKFPELRPAEPQVVGKSVNKGNFGLTWVGTEADDTNFELQRVEAKGGADGGTVSTTIQDRQTTLKGEKQGTYRYKVRNRTVIPATNISAARTTTTSYSDLSPVVKIDRSGPKKPRVILKGKRVKGKKTTFRGKVRVKVVGRPDAKLPDGSAGVGLNRKSVPKPRKIRKNGKKVIKVRTRDKLGNKSKVTRVVIRIRR